MSDKPIVSVLMPVFNAIDNYPDGLWEQVVGHTMTRHGELGLELCVVDDGSQDETASVLDRLSEAYPDIRLAHHTQNQGIAASLNTAVSQARGRYLIIQSMRSWYEPGSLLRMVTALEARPEIGFVYGVTQYHGVRDTRYVPPPFKATDFRQHFASLFGYMYRRSAWDKGCRYIGYLEREGRRIDISDYDFIMQLIYKLGWKGFALRDILALHYLYSGEGQMTQFVHRYQSAIDAIFDLRWGGVDADRLVG